MAHQVRILRWQQHLPAARIDDHDFFARIMELPNHPTNPQQMGLPERQLIHREYALYVLDHIPTAFVPAQRLRNIQAGRPECAKVALYGGRVLQPGLSDGVTKAHNAFGRISTGQFLLVLGHPSRLLRAGPHRGRLAV